MKQLMESVFYVGLVTFGFSVSSAVGIMVLVISWVVARKLEAWL